jgi:NADP-dependent 3-hydroxy acid dehydrogenase YdfG
LDIGNKDSIDVFVEKVKKEFGSVDILVNNAGIAFKGGA